MTVKRAAMSLQQEFLAMLAPTDETEPTEEPFGPWYHHVRGWRFTGPLDFELLQTAADLVVRVHPALRSTLVFGEESHQLIDDPRACTIVRVDLSADGADDADDALKIEQFLNHLESQQLPVD